VEHVVAAGLGYGMELEVRKMMAARFEGPISDHRPLRQYKLVFGERNKKGIQLLTEVWEPEANVKVREKLSEPVFTQGLVGESRAVEVSPGNFVFSVWTRFEYYLLFHKICHFSTHSGC
jgi:hypothetical protein